MTEFEDMEASSLTRSLKKRKHTASLTRLLTTHVLSGDDLMMMSLMGKVSLHAYMALAVDICHWTTK